MEKNKGGRPKKMKDEDYVTVGKLARVGLSKEMIADYVGISYASMYTDTRFLEVYKKEYVELGKKVRTMLLAKAEKDITANIYLDKVLNKTTEKAHDDNIELKRKTLELQRKKTEWE